MNNVEPLFDKVEVVEGAITCERSAPEVDTSRIPAEIPVDIDASEEETVRRHEVIAAKRAERWGRVAAVCEEEERGPPEGLRRKLADAKHELAVIHSPILILPHEITAEIFNWYMLMGGNSEAMLLVCKRWTTVAYSSPRLWSRIVVIDSLHNVVIQGAHVCVTVDYLRSVLSRSQASPLQVELSTGGIPDLGAPKYPPQSSSIRYGPQAAANRDEAFSLILNNKILRRCTYLVLRCFHAAFPHSGLPMVVENETILPLLSSLYIDVWQPGPGSDFFRSLIKFSPSPRHIHFGRYQGDLEVGVWTKRIESCVWLDANESCRVLDGSSSLRELGIDGCLDVALTLPALQVLRWSPSARYTLHLITAPNLHTLILTYQRISIQGLLRPSRITLPNLRVAIHADIYNLINIRAFQTPALEHPSIQSPARDPTGLITLFDGSAHMPTPKSLHLDCAFTDAVLIAVLCRLPWLEELQVAGTVARHGFWDGLTPSSKPTWPQWLPASYPDERANRILVPNLKVLLVNYSKGIG